MGTVSEAIKQLEKKYPNQRIISGLDMGDFYAFSMVPRNINPKSILDLPVQPTMKAICKSSGEEFNYHLFLSPDGNIKSTIDIVSYVSSEDAAFSRYVKELLEG